MHFTAAFRQQGLSGWRAVERRFDIGFGSWPNPLRHLGALAFLAFWLLAISGVALYILFDTSVDGAYRSISDLATEPVGRLARGMHRYAADSFVILTGLHVLREWLHRHERGFRRFSWLTGVPLIGFMAVSAIGGFWLHWDQLGQYSAVATAEWLDAMPLWGTPLARNFLVADAVNDRLIALLMFVHVGVPLLLLFGLWFHIQRISRAAVLPPRSLAVGLTAVLAGLALAWPVTSHPPAELGSVPPELRLDWILLFLHPLTDATSPEFTWLLVAGVALALLALPFLPQPVRAPVAVVDAANCNGCRRCFADCPYAAITMVKHPNQRIGRALAEVDADLCAGCGICAGACPSSTPFRRAGELVTGIDMPQGTVGDLRRRLRQALTASRAPRPLVVFGCDHGARSAAVDAPDVSTFSLLCAGQLPPSFVEYALREGAAGVVVAPCPRGGCEFRLGDRWTADRLQGRREPSLRSSVPASRMALVAAGPGDESTLSVALDRMRRGVRALSAQSEHRQDA